MHPQITRCVIFHGHTFPHLWSGKHHLAEMCTGNMMTETGWSFLADIWLTALLNSLFTVLFPFLPVQSLLFNQHSARVSSWESCTNRMLKRQHQPNPVLWFSEGPLKDWQRREEGTTFYRRQCTQSPFAHWKLHRHCFLFLGSKGS